MMFANAAEFTNRKATCLQAAFEQPENNDLSG
jgi:hypothetical protein